MLSKREYAEIVNKTQPRSKVGVDCLRAFLFGGAICVIGEAIVQVCISLGVSEADGRTWAAVILVLLGAVLTGFGVYDKIAKHAGAGTVVPITGFANSIVSAAMEYRSEGLVMGIGAKMFTVAGPVLVYGYGSASVVGIIWYIFGI